MLFQHPMCPMHHNKASASQQKLVQSVYSFNTASNSKRINDVVKQQFYTFDKSITKPPKYWPQQQHCHVKCVQYRPCLPKILTIAQQKDYSELTQSCVFNSSQPCTRQLSVVSDEITETRIRISPKPNFLT